MSPDMFENLHMPWWKSNISQKELANLLQSTKMTCTKAAVGHNRVGYWPIPYVQGRIRPFLLVKYLRNLFTLCFSWMFLCSCLTLAVMKPL